MKSYDVRLRRGLSALRPLIQIDGGIIQTQQESHKDFIRGSRVSNPYYRTRGSS
jgi:hypothetical protein